MSEVNSVDGMQSVQKYYAINMVKKCLESSMGDGMEFELVYEALLDSLEDENSQVSQTLNQAFGISDSGATESSNKIGNSTIKTAAGTALKDLDLVTNDGMSGLIYNSELKNIVSGTLSSTVTNASSADIDAIVQKYANQYGIDPKLVSALIYEESGYQTNATSSAGAKGLMQLMPSVCQQFGVSNPYDPEQNIEGGVKLLNYLMNYYNNDLGMALMAYSVGTGTVASRGVTSINDLYKMPAETRNYIKKLSALYDLNL